MLDQTTRTAVLKLHEAGHGTRAIATALRISRGAVKRVLASRSAAPPPLARVELAEPYREQILALYDACKGNLVRVHEELVAQGARLSYPALTASLVLCHSRMLFFQHYPRFNRFTCKLFLTDALRYFGGACGVCMIDNTSVVVASGTGANMVPAPEMAAFAERLGFVFRAHEKGDANRSGRVERPFHYIENNFLAGRTFDDWEALNREAVAWCDKVNALPKRHLHAAPRELFAAEKPRLVPLPLWVPDVYALHHRIVDVEGYVNVHQNRYSAPWQLIGRRVEVRETKERIEIFDGPRLVASHARVLDANSVRITEPAHRPPRGQGRSARGDVSVEEEQLLRLAPELGDYVARLKRHGRGLRDVRRLLRMVGDYPRGPLVEAVRTAMHYGLYDLERVERMLLRSLARDFFFVAPGAPRPDAPESDPDPEDPDDG